MAENPYEQYRNIPPSSPAAAADGAAEDNPYKQPALPAGYDPLTRRPFQYVGNAPPGDPVAQSTGRPIADDRIPGPAVQAAGSLAADPEQKRRIIAMQLFPNLDPKEAVARVFYGPNGRMAAVGEDGQSFYVDPDRPDFSLAPGAGRSLMPGNLAANAATIAGAALPAIGGAAAGAAAGPTSPIMGPAAAAAGAALGDFFRQKLAASFDPESAKTPYNYRQTGGEALGAGAGQAVGAGAIRGFAPNRVGLSSADIRNIRRDPGVLQRANDLYEEGRRQGVTLTPGQASGLPSLIANEDVLASGSTRASAAQDIAAEFYKGQRNELNTMLAGYQDTVAPNVGGKTDAALMFQQGAEDATRLTRQNANTAARPAYQAAERGGNVMSPDLAQLMDAPAMQDALKAARVEYANMYRKAAPETPDFALWDLAKRKLDDVHTVAKRAGENTTAMTVDQLRGDLLTHLDTAYPTYGTARELAAPGQRLAARLEGTVGGAGDGTERARAILAPVWDGSNPRAVAEAREAFYAAKRGDEWMAGVRARIQDKLDDASRSQDGLNPAMLRRQLWGAPNSTEREMMQAAMTPQQFAGFEKVMETIEASAKSRGMNSLTAGRAAGAERLTEAAEAEFGNRLVRGVGALASPQRALDLVGRGADKISGAMTVRSLNKMAERLFSPDGMALLQQAALMSPGSRRLLTMTTEFLGQQTGDSDVVAGRTSPGPYLPRNSLGP